MVWWKTRIKNKKGSQAEDRATEFLIEQGLSLLARNYAFRGGELDLVMLEGSTIVFCEVRYRKNDVYGSALETITARKQAKIQSAAAHYLQVHNMSYSVVCRFDVIAVNESPNTSTNKKSVRWIKNAFGI